MIRITALEPSLLGAWAALFEACHVTCYCRFWHFGGTKNDWLARCAFSPNENKGEQSALVRSAAPEARGLLAMEGDVAIGWMKLAPRASLPKLRNQGAYRAIDLGDDAGVYSIGCFLVHPSHRQKGVARALVAAAETHVRAWGGRAVEAYPRHVDHHLHDEQAMAGPEDVFIACGFTKVAGEGPYPVYRLTLDV
jgi:GNAT superfamily N-acetyltransferase